MKPCENCIVLPVCKNRVVEKVKTIKKKDRKCMPDYEILFYALKDCCRLIEDMCNITYVEDFLVRYNTCNLKHLVPLYEKVLIRPIKKRKRK